jgi:hypothetical protein
MSEFKGKIMVGVTVAIVAAMGLAVAFAAFTPSGLQSNTSTPIGNYTTVTSSTSLPSTSSLSLQSTTSIAPYPPATTTSSSQAETSQPTPPLSKSADGWDFTVSLTSTSVEQGQNITADFSLTNIAGQNQTVDIGNPLVVPEVYWQNGTEIFTNWNPTGINQVENISSGQTVSLNRVTIATFKLHPGETYVVALEPIIQTANDSVFIGQALEINATITINASTGTSTTSYTSVTSCTTMPPANSTSTYSSTSTSSC